MNAVPAAQSARAVTPGGKGRFAGFDVLDRGGPLGRRHRRGGPGPPGPASPTTASSPRPSRPPPRPCSTGCWPRTTNRRCRCCSWSTAPGRSARPTAGATRTCPRTADAWRLTLAALDDDARTGHDDRFQRLASSEQAAWSRRCTDAETWHGLAAAHVWSLWTRYACAAFYSHPWAWNEIGFGGPAYPAATRPSASTRRERWEVADDDRPRPGRLGRRVEARQAPLTTGAARRARTTNAVSEPRSATRPSGRRNESAWLLPDGDDRTNHGSGPTCAASPTTTSSTW